MIFLPFVFIFALLPAVSYSEVSGINLPSYIKGKSCNKTVSVLASRRVPYKETFKQKSWGIFYRTQVRWNYKTEYYTSLHKEFACCEGYVDAGYQICKPVCQPACGNGICYKPNKCICNYGYTQEKDIVFDAICVPTCSHTCINGKCTSPEVCTCNRGYSLTTDDYTCEPVCDEKCDTGSYCSEPNHCACLPGYSEINNTYWSKPNKCNPICENECVHGRCVTPNTCICDDGYEIDPDNMFVCKPKCDRGCFYGTCVAPNTCSCDLGYSLKDLNVCEPICNETCIMGTCIAPDTCSCFDGYGLFENSTYICEPVCEKTCLNGKCTEPGVCTCNEGFQLNSAEPYDAKHICEPYCEISCQPFGACTAPGVCTCFEGYRLVDNTQDKNISNRYFADNSVCEPICNAECINGFCIAPDTCSCNPGYHPSGDNATNVCEPSCSHNCINGFCSAPETCTCEEGYRSSDNDSSNTCEPFCEAVCINGYCSAPNKCACNDGYQFAEGNGTNFCEPICNPNCTNGHCILPNLCDCKRGFRKSTYSTNVCDPICHTACETNGICEAPDFCVCKDGYRMVYYPEKDIPFKCEPICRNSCGNGTCTAPELCVCFEGYQNADSGTCEPICAECNNGTCVAPDVCECHDGFILEELDVKKLSFSEDRSRNESRCVPHCKNCENGECVAPNECRCHVGFVKIKDTCVNACENDCGIHGECDDERRICECNYGWTGVNCERPTICVLILNDERNRTESSSVVEKQNTTITHVLMNNPPCSQTCIDKVYNDTLCFKLYTTDTKNDTQIGCFMNEDCFTLSSQYRGHQDITKISGIAGGIGILLLIAATVTVYTLRKRRNRQMDLVPGNVYSASLQGLVEQNIIRS